MRILTFLTFFFLSFHPLLSLSSSPTDHDQLPDSKAVIALMFQWDWDSIATECVNFLGPAGYGFIQVSPPQEHITGPQWWTDYNPVSYILTTKRGNRSQFQNMISACHSAGVKVITDTIFNHMTELASGVGVAGSTFTHYVYPGIYDYENFHHCGLEPNDTLVNWNNPTEVRFCEAYHGADLATETEYVRARLAEFGNDLLSLGVDGLRLDLASNMPVEDISNILSRLSPPPSYVTQVVDYTLVHPIEPSEYVGNGDVQEYRYTKAIQSAFLTGGISSLQDLDNQGWVSGSHANVFVADFGTERDNGSLTIDTAANTYITASIFSLAHPYGTPTILSSFLFSGPSDPAPNNGTGSCSDTGGSGGWLCQHRFVAITGMVGFHNNVGSAPLTDWVSPQSQQIAFGRGSFGFVAINNVDSEWKATFSTSLPDGSYCDVISGACSFGGCTGVSFTVHGGSFTATIPPRSAIAIHTGALGHGSSTYKSVAVTFQETATTTDGEKIFLTGSIPELGSWNPDSSIALSSFAYPVWNVTLPLRANINFQYKFIRKENNGTVILESDPTRQANIATSGAQTITTLWR